MKFTIGKQGIAMTGHENDLNRSGLEERIRIFHRVAFSSGAWRLRHRTLALSRLVYMESHYRLSSNCRQFKPFLDVITSPKVRYSHPVKNTNSYFKSWPIYIIFVSSHHYSLFSNRRFHCPFLFILTSRSFFHTITVFWLFKQFFSY